MKRQGFLFTYLQMRAVDLDVSHFLSAGSFIRNLWKFLSFKDTPSAIFTDSGINFIGTQCEFRDIMKNWFTASIPGIPMQTGVQWTLILFTPLNEEK